MFAGFEEATIELDGVAIHYRVHRSAGPALLLLHGHPQTHVIWHKVANRLARDYTVVCADLRGYGDSGKPEAVADHANYSKRAMALDMVKLMSHLGFEEFFVVGHDRGGRVAHRLAADHPQRVRKLAVLDIAPTLTMYEQTSMAFAQAYYHWFFLIQPAQFPETLLGADPEFYLLNTIGGRSSGMAPFAPEAVEEYKRCIKLPGTIRGICEDYRASATIDLEHDRADIAAGHKLAMPLLALWGAHGVVEKCFKPLDEWRKVASDVRGCALPSGHYIPEEVPELLLNELTGFLEE
ncbi:alpha/beta hydrolase [Noviherbaspirillum cavernae]|uniref:Alpha/beta hydrolase n=1 Tax=Noviherbaspirillum cavernae TaxID=2320862 RepID=A0A418WZ23_9BURK|nr:alpha/beta hydrolase [Noviherbaspirillum cavernae]RJG05488.1 alpha/beta hydrolase [Noviherbaspirillum cavernae]